MIGAYAIDALQLAARPVGVTCPQMRARMSTKASPGKLLLRLSEEGLLVRTGSRRHYHYTITPAGRGVLERELTRQRAAAQASQVAPARPPQRATWERAPMVGSPHPQPKPARVIRPEPVPISAGYDSRFQVDPDTFQGGEFVAEWRRLRGLA